MGLLPSGVGATKRTPDSWDDSGGVTQARSTRSCVPCAVAESGCLSLSVLPGLSGMDGVGGLAKGKRYCKGISLSGRGSLTGPCASVKSKWPECKMAR